MRRFRLNIIIYSVFGICTSAISGYLYALDKIAWGIVATLISMLCVGMLIYLMRKAIHITSTFIAALENNDQTIRFEIECDDSEIKEMTRSMNRIMTIYHGNRLKLETRKLYYDRILRIMTHEMRNSITPVIALSNDYASHPEKYNREMLTETMKVIGIQSESIKKFLDSYYNLTHLPEPRKEDIDAAEFCNRLKTLTGLEEQRRGFEKNICHYSVPIGMKISMDSNLMTQAVMNIIRNSLDAVANVANPRVDISVSISDGVPFITIKDNGPGLPETVRNNLFQPFITTKQGGSGIGLSLTRQICRLHGGDLTISSSHHIGTTATLTLQR